MSTDTATPPPPPPPPPPGAPSSALDDRERPLDPAVKIVWRVLGGIGAAVPLGVGAIAGTVLLDRFVWIPGVLAAAVFTLAVGWYPGARYRRWRWRLSDLALELRYGVMVRRYEAVPFFRIQQIDVAQGPVDRLVGLATLVVTTASASGSASLPGIDADEAPRVRQELLARAASALERHGGDGRDAV